MGRYIKGLVSCKYCQKMIPRNIVNIHLYEECTNFNHENKEQLKKQYLNEKRNQEEMHIKTTSIKRKLTKEEILLKKMEKYNKRMEKIKKIFGIE